VPAAARIERTAARCAGLYPSASREAPTRPRLTVVARNASTARAPLRPVRASTTTRPAPRGTRTNPRCVRSRQASVRSAVRALPLYALNRARMRFIVERSRRMRARAAWPAARLWAPLRPRRGLARTTPDACERDHFACVTTDHNGCVPLQRLRRQQRFAILASGAAAPRHSHRSRRRLLE